MVMHNTMMSGSKGVCAYWRDSEPFPGFWPLHHTMQSLTDVLYRKRIRNRRVIFQKHTGLLFTLTLSCFLKHTGGFLRERCAGNDGGVQGLTVSSCQQPVTADYNIAARRCFKLNCAEIRSTIPYLTVQKAKKAEKRDIYAKKWDFTFLPRFPKLS